MITLHTLRLYALIVALTFCAVSSIRAQLASIDQSTRAQEQELPTDQPIQDDLDPQEANQTSEEPFEEKPETLESEAALPQEPSLKVDTPTLSTNTIAISDQPTEQPLTIKKNKRNARKNEFEFIYNDEELVNIVNELATLKDFNIVLPQGNLAIKAKVTLNIERPFSIDGAWDLLQTLLDLAGYVVIPKGNIQVIVKKDKDISKEPLPVFIGTDIEKLPATDERIRFLYYLTNIKLQKEGDGEVNKILQALLPTDASFLIDENANALVIIARSQDIRAVMSIIIQLDKPGFQEKMDFVHLRHSSAAQIATLFNESILKGEQGGMNRYHLDARKKENITYFAQNVRIIPDLRSNSLIIVGRSQAVERIKDFIFQYIDVEISSGQSILHIYELQYLDAKSFKPVLERIILSSRPGGTGQSQAGQVQEGGLERGFEGVLVQVDETQSTAPEDRKYFGSNKLIIAARNDDWKRIKKLIEQLDTPQRQVLIEVLIADLTLTDSRLLGGMIRNPAKIPFGNQSTFQSSQIDSAFPGSPGIITDSFQAPQTLGANDSFTTGQPIASDLLRKAYNNAGAKQDGGTESAAALLAAGSTVLSFSDNDGKTWGILQVLKLFENAKILSHPHVLATDNTLAKITIDDIRLVPGSVTNTSGNPVRNFENIEAKLLLEIKPRIGGAANTVNLNVDIKIDEFTGSASDTRVTRQVLTNANVNSGDILALGGLVKINNENGANETPLISRIPIIGSFFKKRSQTGRKTNLTVFISPTIIEPRLRKGISRYTNDYIGLAKNYAAEGALFDTLKDPVTRWFFKTGNEGSNAMDNFLAQQTLLANNSDVVMPDEALKIKKAHSQNIPARTCPPRRNRWKSRQERREIAQERRQERQGQRLVTPQNDAPQPGKSLKEHLLSDGTNPFSNLNGKNEAIFNP